MEYIAIILRMIFFYIFIIFIYRIMGKREVGQLGIVDLIVSILIAELVAICIENPKLRTVLDGSPSFIIKNGKVNYNEMIRQKYNLDDLLTQLREKGYRNIEDVEYAILENNGTLSIFSYQDKTKTPLPLPLILDGKIQYETLKEMHKEKSFVDNLLKKKKLNLEDIFYAFYKDTSIFVIKYRDLD